MTDWSEPIRKKGYLLNFQTKKLQEIQDRNIVSKLHVKPVEFMINNLFIIVVKPMSFGRGI